MKPISAQERRKILTTCRSEVMHLEMRDVYATDVEKDRFAAWRRGEPLDPDAEAQWWAPWFELMTTLTASGVTLRRLRIVSSRSPITSASSGLTRRNWFVLVKMFGGYHGAMPPRCGYRATIFGCSTGKR